MRIEGQVFSISWIPSEAITGTTKIPMEVGLGHYDDPPPDHVEDLETLEQQGRFRFANRLRAAIEVDDDGSVTDVEQLGRDYISTTDVYVAGRAVFAFQPVALPVIRTEPEVGDGWVRFRQTAGGRTGAPMPRPVNQAPFFRMAPPTAWTTLALTIHTDGTIEHEVIGASPFPRHWIYDDGGNLVAKSGITDFATWSREHFGDNSPWGEIEETAMITEVETALERRLSLEVMRGGAKPEIRTLEQGELLTQQGRSSRELYLLLDGVVTVEVDEEPVAQLGPGVILGERAILEEGRRTSTVKAETPIKVAVAAADQLDPEALRELADAHRREDQTG